jgi:UDP-glucose 4-epimerase
MPTLALRYFNVYGPRMMLEGAYVTIIGIFLDQRCRGQPLTIHGDRAQTRDFTHVRDVVRANLLAMDSTVADGRALNIARGRNFSVGQIAAMVGGPTIHQEPRLGGARDTPADIAQAEAILGWTPEVATEDGVCELMFSSGVH